MSSSRSHIKAENIDTFEKRKNHTIGVVGCRRLGILHARFFAEAGFRVVCVDADQTITNQLVKGRAPFFSGETETKLREHARAGQLEATNDYKAAIMKSDIIIITTPVNIDSKSKTNYSELEKTCKHVGSALKHNSLVILASTVGLGITEGLVRETIENTSGLKAGMGFGLAYSPVRIAGLQNSEAIISQQRLVAANERNDLVAASAILETITKNEIKKTESIKCAEIAALLEASRHDVNLAFINEAAVLCEKAGADFHETYELIVGIAQSTPSSPALSNEQTKNLSCILLESAEDLSTKPRVSAVAIEVNDEVIKHVIALIRDSLKTCEKTMMRARIVLLGITETPNLKGRPKDSILVLARMLEAKGARVSLYDPYVSNDEIPDMQRFLKKTFAETLDKADCLVISTGHDQFKRLNLNKLKLMMKMPAAIVDLERTVDPAKIEKEGFVYRGLGRGVWTR